MAASLYTVSSTLKPFQPLELSTPHQQEDTAAFGEGLDISSSLSHTLQVQTDHSSPYLDASGLGN